MGWLIFALIAFILIAGHACSVHDAGLREQAKQAVARGKAEKAAGHWVARKMGSV